MMDNHMIEQFVPVRRWPELAFTKACVLKLRLAG